MSSLEKYESMTEEVLVRRIIAGDDKAFEYLVEAYNKKVFNIALRILNNYEDASDITQDIFLKIYRKIHTFKENCSFYTWVYRLSVNTCIDELRRRKNFNTVSIDSSLPTEDGEMSWDIADDSDSADELLQKKEVRQILRRAISQLPDIYRVLLILREYDGLSYQEISQIINIPIGTVKSRINRARIMLRNLLKEGNYFK